MQCVLCWPARAVCNMFATRYGESRVKFLRSKCRSQCLWNLTLAGDFHPAYEDGSTPGAGIRKHHMRVMLTANLAVDSISGVRDSAVRSPRERGRSACRGRRPEKKVDMKFANGSQDDASFKLGKLA